MQFNIQRSNSVFLRRCAPILILALFVTSPVRAQIIVDDFTATGGEAFPILVEYPAFGYLGAPTPVGGVFAGVRGLSAIFGGFLPEPGPDDSSVLIDIDPAPGVLHVKAGADSTIDFNIFWSPAFFFFAFANSDVTQHPKLAIDYSSNVDLDLTIRVANLSTAGFSTSPETSAGNQLLTVLPAASNGRFLVDIADITDPLPNLAVPSADFTSLDSIGMSLQTDQLGADFFLSRVAFVPEPSTIGLLLLSTIFLVLSPRPTQR